MNKKINEFPLTTDSILFEFKTYNGNLLIDPYKVNKLEIYYVERDFSSHNFNEYTDSIYLEEKLKAATIAEEIAANDPTSENIAIASRKRLDAESTKVNNSLYFNEAKLVHTVGNFNFPAWFSTDLENALIEKVEEDEDGNTLIGNFQYIWQPQGMREGDYFVCYTWTPLLAGDHFSCHEKFYLKGNNAVTNLPIHVTKPGKYETLLEKYTPEVFKMKLCDSDRTPDVIDKLNKSVADGFTVLEDLANQIIDLYDANVLDESLLPYLSNFFDIKLKSNDPTRWRKQIKRAIPLFKKKGTFNALEEALDQAGVKLLSYKGLWQIISSYTWQESFEYIDENHWELKKPALSIDLNNFGLWLKAVESDEYISLSSDYVTFTTQDGITTLTWIGDTLQNDPIDLIEGDILKVLYKYALIPDQNIENYIRSLPLADQRDEKEQKYPLKNWNIRVVQQNDPLFETIINNRHPYHDDIVFGVIRTEFPYSENIYNMDEYSGSLRNSKRPCDIDKNFLDSCTACLSSKYNIDVEIEELTNDKIVETRQILQENMPFHSVLHTMNIFGGIYEFMEPPKENIETLIKYSLSENIISGNTQLWFNRNMRFININRDELAESSLVKSGNGTLYNDNIVLFCGETNFEEIGLGDTPILEILTSNLAGSYDIFSPNKNIIKINSLNELDEINSIFENMELSSKAFNFRVSNKITDGSITCEVVQDNIYQLTDNDFSIVKTQWDGGNVWKIKIDNEIYEIKNILPDNILILENNGTLPPNNSTVNYYLLNHLDEVQSSGTGSLKVIKRGRTIGYNVSNLHLNWINHYQIVNGEQYPILGLSNNDEFYIGNYDNGGLGGITLEIYQRLVENKIGYLSYRGLKLHVNQDIESELNINNGENPVSIPLEDNNFIENFLVEIDSNLYFMSNIDQGTIALSGLEKYAKTLTAGGTSKNYNIYKYTKTENISIPGQQFDLPTVTFNNIDRQGKEIITNINETSFAAKFNGYNEKIQQNEGINFQIEYKNGSSEQGTI